MREPDVEAIAAEWLVRTGSDPPALRAFLAEAVPDVDAWALRRAGAEPQILAVTPRHLYRVQSAEEAGRRAFAFDRLPLDETTVALLELRDDGAVRRRWTLRTRDEGLTIETEQLPGEDPPALERVMWMVLEHAH